MCAFVSCELVLLLVLLLPRAFLVIIFVVLFVVLVCVVVFVLRQLSLDIGPVIGLSRAAGLGDQRL